MSCIRFCFVQVTPLDFSTGVNENAALASAFMRSPSNSLALPAISSIDQFFPMSIAFVYYRNNFKVKTELFKVWDSCSQQAHPVQDDDQNRGLVDQHAASHMNLSQEDTCQQ